MPFPNGWEENPPVFRHAPELPNTMHGRLSAKQKARGRKARTRQCRRRRQIRYVVPPDAVCSSSQPSFRRPIADADSPVESLPNSTSCLAEVAGQDTRRVNETAASRLIWTGACKRIDGEKQIRWCQQRPLRDRAPRLAGGDQTDTGRHLAFRLATVAHDPLVAVCGLQIGMLAAKSATSASTEWASRERAPLRKISVSWSST